MIAAQSVDAAISALRTGQTVILPTDTVYGLCVDAYHEAPIRRLLETDAVNIERNAINLEQIVSDATSP